MPGSPQTDEEIATAVQRGDSDRYRELMERYEPKLRRYGAKFLDRSDDIGDLVQDVFVQAYKNIKNFDTAQRFSPWMYRIAHNAFANELRRKSRHPIILPDFDILFAHTASPERADKESEKNELARMVEVGLAKVEPKFREVLVLYFIEELSYKEIADVLHVPVNTVGVRLSRAKKALRDIYQTLNMSYEQ